MNTISCKVESLTSLTAHIFKVLLQPSQKVNFIPGQYLNIVMSDEDKRPFSIASSPNSDLIELQIGAFVADSYPMQVIERIKSAQADNKSVMIEIPLGKAQLRTDSERPLLLLAGGTGFSYINSMLKYLAEQKSQRHIMVYWGLRELSAAYELEETAKIIAEL
nr:NAD(P)H-flavin reductase [Colwellia sp.]